MHSSRMRTSHTLGGLHDRDSHGNPDRAPQQRPPRTVTPRQRPPRQRPPWTETPHEQRLPWTESPHPERDSPGQRPPTLDRQTPVKHNLHKLHLREVTTRLQFPDVLKSLGYLLMVDKRRSDPVYITNSGQLYHGGGLR